MENSTSKNRIIAYCRVSTKKQILENQEHSIMKYCQDNKLLIDEWIRLDISSRKLEVDRKITYLVESLKSNDTLIVSEISRLGRSTGMVVTFVEKLINAGVRLIVIKQNLDVSKDTSNMTSRLLITVFSMVAEMERDLISERTIMALDRIRSEGRTLGRPKGSTGRSMLDGKEDEIRNLVKHGVSLRAIGRLMGCSDTTVKWFIRTKVNKIC